MIRTMPEGEKCVSLLAGSSVAVRKSIAERPRTCAIMGTEPIASRADAGALIHEVKSGILEEQLDWGS